MSSPVFESMTKMRIGQYAVRVWRTENSLKAACVAKNTDLRALAPALTGADSVHEMISIVQTVPRVAAVEIIDGEGNGVVAYADWP